MERRGRARIDPLPAPLAVRLTLAVFAILVVLFSGLAPRHADAHAIGLSRGDYCFHDGRLETDLVFSRTEIADLDPSNRIAVTRAGKTCTPAAPSWGDEENDGRRLRLTFDCPHGATGDAATVDLGFLDELPFGHRHLASIAGRSADRGASDVHLAFRSSRSFEVPPHVEPCPAASPASMSRGKSAPSLLGFVALGVEHILTGWDHLVFLLGVILVGGRLRALLGVVTAFTIGHSITLALAALDVVTPGTWIVEAAIALSIAWVGLENFWVENAEKRWRLTLPFGLVHGFGFAGALRDIGLPKGQVVEALVSFNVGVEVGQMAVMAVVLPVVFWGLRTPWFATRGVKIVSGAIVAAGLLWFLQRTLLA